MTNIVTTLLDFILDLLKDPAKAQAFNDDPHAALASAGLTGVTVDDVKAVAPMVADCSPVRDWQASYTPHHSGPGSSSSHGTSAGHHESHDSGAEAAQRPHTPERDHHDDDHDHDHRPPSQGDHDAPEHQGQELVVIQHLQNIQNTFSYTQVDVQLDHSIWAQDGSNVFFGDDNVLNTGGGVVLDDVDTHGGDVDVHDTRTSVDVSDSFNGSFNHAEGPGAVAGNGNEVDNSRTETTDSHDIDFHNAGDAAYAGGDQAIGNTVVKDSYNPTHVSDSGNVGSIVGSDGSHLGDTTSDQHNEYDTDIHTDNSVHDSGNTDDSVHDSGNVVDSGNTDASTNDSYDGNDLFSHNDVSDNAVAVHDSLAAADNSLELAH